MAVDAMSAVESAATASPSKGRPDRGASGGKTAAERAVARRWLYDIAMSFGADGPRGSSARLSQLRRLLPEAGETRTLHKNGHSVSAVVTMETLLLHQVSASNRYP